MRLAQANRRRILINTQDVVLWTPSELTTTLWLDAADSDSITIATGVSSWNDKSGNLNHAVQTTGSSQPTYTASDPILNNKPTIKNGTSVQYLQTPSLGAKRMYFVAYYSDGITTTFDNHNGLFNGSECRLTGRSGDNRVFDGTRSANNFDNPDSGATQYRNGSTTDSAYQANGLPMPGDIFKITSWQVWTQDWLILSNTQAWTYWNGGLGEIIFTDGTEDLTTQKKVEGYLAHKWGLEAKLPIDHPYKDNAPTV